MDDTFIVTVNGEQRQTRASCTVADLLAALGVPEKGVAVERNRSIIPKSQYGATRLRHDDQLEIISFVGGG